MAKLSSDNRFVMLTQDNPSRAIQVLNNLLYQYTSPMDRFVTLVAAALDPVQHTVTLVSGGHPSPLLIRRGNNVGTDAMPLEVTGVPLGMLENYEYGACQVQLEPGDALIFFTDGVNEAVNVRNAQFGLDGIQTIIQASEDRSARALGERLIKAVKQHALGRSPHDDVTLVCVSRSS
jgi:serine phosphatase RsbU (regulator of sigma subunit)